MMSKLSAFATATVLALGAAGSAHALEGGTSAYFLGSRDTAAGIVGKPGTTIITNNSYYFHATGPALSLGGIAAADPSINIFLNRVDIAHFFDVDFWGGTPGIVINVPAATGKLTADGVLGRYSGTLEDDNSGFSDPIITPIIGWQQGNWHYSASVSFFIPWGKYNSATVGVGIPPEINDFLNFGKNRATIMPAFSVTYLDPTNGLEFSGAVNVEFPLTNHATDWTTAPILNVEGAVLQHLPNGIAFGVAGYASKQLGEDSGAGAESFKATLGAASLNARVFGVGPIATYNTKFGETPVGFKLKYMHEFAAERRFESDVVSFSANFTF